MKDKKKEL